MILVIDLLVVNPLSKWSQCGTFISFISKCNQIGDIIELLWEQGPVGPWKSNIQNEFSGKTLSLRFGTTCCNIT